jgi:hypothetical protein
VITGKVLWLTVILPGAQNLSSTLIGSEEPTEKVRAE